MLIGVLFSAVMGGLAGTAWALTQNHDLIRVLVSYPLGGLLAVTAFVLLSLLRADPFQPQVLPRD